MRHYETAQILSMENTIMPFPYYVVTIEEIENLL